MKTERSNYGFIGMALLAWLAFASVAQAFYNPNSGRWLSRDPIDEASFRVHTLAGAQDIDDALGNLSGTGEAAGLWPYGIVGNSLVNWVDMLGLTVHLAPYNGEAENHSKQETANILGDGLMLIVTYKDGTEKSFRPWSNGEFNNEIGKTTVESYRTIDFYSTHGLGPGKNMQQEWLDGATWIVDSDHLTGATTEVYEDAQCTRKAQLPVKIGWSTLHIYDCPIKTCVKGVYYKN